MNSSQSKFFSKWILRVISTIGCKIISHISVEAINCFHVFCGQFKVKNLQVFFDPLLILTLGQDHNSTLQLVAKSNYG